ncbi:MAG: FAD-binding oxidoreductase, partial [Cellvibrionaceae bacterium]|nr:FAD-binding oxidoreductase [Cellvibrionaceae bacterium]
ELLELNKDLLKNNTGYDMRHLFIGSEGTLGLIVEATMRLTRPPKDLSVLVLGVPDMAAIMKILKAFQDRMELTAFEFFSESGCALTSGHGLQRPFESVCPFYVLLEYENQSEQDGETAMQVFEHCMEQGWVEDGVISQSQAQAENLWALRENLAECCAPFTPYKNDISVTTSQVPGFLEDIDTVVSQAYPDFTLVWWGHIGDGNLHLNILKPEAMDKDEFFAQCQQVNTQVFEIVEKYQGSISAEHGVGLVKKDYLTYTREPAEIALMRSVKLAFDPNNIMNPGKIFDV